MILGKKSKSYVEGLLKENDSLLSELASLRKELLSLKERTDKAILKRDTEIKSLKEQINSKEETSTDFFESLRSISGLSSWSALAEVLGISTTTLSKYRNNKLPVTKELQDKFTFLVTKYIKRG